MIKKMPLEFVAFIHGRTLAPQSKRLMPKSYSPLSAGEFAESADDYEFVDLNELITSGKEGFGIYIIDGDSMVECIPAGSFVVVSPDRVPEKGDIIVSSVNGKNNIKYYEPANNGLFLVPANPKYKKIHVTDRDNFTCLGVVEWVLFSTKK